MNILVNFRLKLKKVEKTNKLFRYDLNQIPYDYIVAGKSLRLCPTLCDPIDGSPPGSPSLGFFRQEHWSGLPFPSPMHESEK